jgi:hypothetical protein
MSSPLVRHWRDGDGNHAWGDAWGCWRGAWRGARRDGWRGGCAHGDGPTPRLAPRLPFVAATGAAIALLAALPTPASADEDRALRGYGFTVYAGSRFGGEYEDEATGEPVKLRDSGSLAVTLDFPLDGQRELQLQYGRQSTELRSAQVAPALGDLPLKLEHLHLGGTYYGDELGNGWYAIGGLGVTRATPSFQGYDSETNLSGHVGFGYLLPFSRHVGVRLEARGYMVLVGGSGTLFCSGGCALRLSGNGFVQGELLAGVSARF